MTMKMMKGQIKILGNKKNTVLIKLYILYTWITLIFNAFASIRRIILFVIFLQSKYAFIIFNLLNFQC